MDTEYPEDFLARLHAVTGKRPKTVIDHILKFGQITTEDLKDLYGYAHPPRAIKDVTDLGIPIERHSVKAQDGRTIAAYRFGDPTAVRSAVHGGRTNFPKRFKQQLIDRDGTKCGSLLRRICPSLPSDRSPDSLRSRWSSPGRTQVGRIHARLQNVQPRQVVVLRTLPKLDNRQKARSVPDLFLVPAWKLHAHRHAQNPPPQFNLE